MENSKPPDNIIVLSDSDESISIVETEGYIEKKLREVDASSDSSFDFPEVNFNYNKNFTENDKRHIHDDSESNSDTDVLPVLYNNEMDSGVDSKASSSKDSQDSTIDSIMKTYTLLKKFEDTTEKKKSKSQAQKTQGSEKERLKIAKQKKKDEQTREKALKIIASKNLKKLKPEEYFKSMEIIIDENIQSRLYFTNIISSLQESQITFRIEPQLIPYSITWLIEDEDNYLNESGEIVTSKTSREGDQMLLFWDWKEVVEKISEHTFTASLQSICDLVPNKRITLVIYGITSYFLYHKNRKDKAMRDEILGKENSRKGNSKQDQIYGSLPKISRLDLEIALAEIQLLNNCSNRIIKTHEELALIVIQYTKAIAELPYKLEKNKNMEDKLSWYAAGDNRDTVKVDKDGNGLKRLWQQQLCQFNLSSFEIAEAICQVYGSPVQLIEAYMKCSEAEGKMLLKDIPIKRAAGPGTNLRRIGPELSEKIYKMFTSTDGEIPLN